MAATFTIYNMSEHDRDLNQRSPTVAISFHNITLPFPFEIRAPPRVRFEKIQSDYGKKERKEKMGQFKLASPCWENEGMDV